MPGGTRDNIAALDTHTKQEAQLRVSGDLIAERRAAMIRHFIPVNEELLVPAGFGVVVWEEFVIEEGAELALEEGAFLMVNQ